MKMRLFLLLFLGMCTVVHAAEFTGVAPLGESGPDVARAAAIADALENASLNAGAQIKASALTGAGQLV